MLKGHTRIELTDVHTGRKEVVEKHNLITNNLSKYFEKMCLYYGLKEGRYRMCPLYKKGMGGIVLLRDPITKDANSFHVPYSSLNLLTGCAFNGINTTTDEKIGSKNLTESMVLDNGYKHVWDFGTSQANGTISAVALTHSDACTHPGSVFAYPQQFATVKFNKETTDLWEYLTDYDFDNNIATVIKVVDSSTVSVIKYKFDLPTVHLLDDGNSSYPVISQLKLSETSVQSSLELNVDGFWLDGFDGYYYYVYVKSTVEQYIARMSKDNLQIDTSYGLNKLNLNLNSSSYTQRQYISKYCAVANGYLYAPGSGSNVQCQKINLSDLSDIKKISNKSMGWAECASDGTLIYTNGQVLFPDDTFAHYNYSNPTVDNTDAYYSFWSNLRYSDYQPKIIMSKNGECLWVNNARYYIYFGYCMNNLNTINNLDAPVIKTADKTMKIIYTLTET